MPSNYVYYLPYPIAIPKFNACSLSISGPHIPNIVLYLPYCNAAPQMLVLYLIYPLSPIYQCYTICLFSISPPISECYLKCCSPSPILLQMLVLYLPYCIATPNACSLSPISQCYPKCLFSIFCVPVLPQMLVPSILVPINWIPPIPPISTQCRSGDQIS